MRKTTYNNNCSASQSEVHCDARYVVLGPTLQGLFDHALRHHVRSCIFINQQDRLLHPSLSLPTSSLIASQTPSEARIKYLSDGLSSCLEIEGFGITPDLKSI